MLKNCFIWGMCTTVLYRKLAGGYKNKRKVYRKSQHPYHQEKWKEMQQKPYFSSMIRYYMHFGALYEEQESICAVLNVHMHREPMKVVTWRSIHKPLSLSFNKATRIDEMDSWLMNDKLSATWLCKKHQKNVHFPTLGQGGKGMYAVELHWTVSRHQIHPVFLRRLIWGTFPVTFLVGPMCAEGILDTSHAHGALDSMGMIP